MMLVMALTIPLPIYFGRVKMKLAEELHDKVLYADADMDKADWMTAVGSIVGVAGIGIGLWWMGAAAALFIALSIVWDAGARVRDPGHVLHLEAFVVPANGRRVSLEKLTDARDRCIDLDWRVQDIVVVPVDELPAEVGGHSERQSERSQ